MFSTFHPDQLGRDISRHQLCRHRFTLGIGDQRVFVPVNQQKRRVFLSFFHHFHRVDHPHPRPLFNRVRPQKSMQQRTVAGVLLGTVFQPFKQRRDIGGAEAVDYCFDFVRKTGMFIGAIDRVVTGQPDQQRGVAAGRGAPDADTVRVNFIGFGVFSQKTDCGLDILQKGRGLESVQRRTVGDHRDNKSVPGKFAHLRQFVCNVREGPSAALYKDDAGKPGRSFRVLGVCGTISVSLISFPPAWE